MVRNALYRILVVTGRSWEKTTNCAEVLRSKIGVSVTEPIWGPLLVSFTTELEKSD